MPNDTPIILYYPAPDEPLSRDELHHILGTALDGNAKLQQALRQLLQERLARATVDSADPDLSERGAGIAAGRIYEISGVQGEINVCLQAAQQMKVSGTGSQRRR